VEKQTAVTIRLKTEDDFKAGVQHGCDV